MRQRKKTGRGFVEAHIRRGDLSATLRIEMTGGVSGYDISVTGTKGTRTEETEDEIHICIARTSGRPVTVVRDEKYLKGLLEYIKNETKTT